MTDSNHIGSSSLVRAIFFGPLSDRSTYPNRHRIAFEQLHIKYELIGAYRIAVLRPKNSHRIHNRWLYFIILFAGDLWEITLSRRKARFYGEIRMNERKPVVLFLCSQNSCRSQMAEAFLKKYAGDLFKIHSAGLEPADEIHPLACKVMEEVGLPLDDQETTSVREYLGEIAVRYAIIVCSVAAEKCPRTWPGLSNRLVWPFEDPAAESSYHRSCP
ncbi:MAG: arsenate reductase ArsC [Planctomycetes bacterium]|nr:arsenate reductase ArsC [Planctomycetota bacterium]